MLPTVVKFMTLGVLCMTWLAMHQQVIQLEPHLVYHLASMRRDRRKAQFYFRSVWVGLISAFLSLGCLEAFNQVTFDSAMVRETAFGALRGLGLWGLLIVGMVWLRIGLRASRPNLDGDSLLPAPDERNDKDSNSRR